MYRLGHRSQGPTSVASAVVGAVKMGHVGHDGVKVAVADGSGAESQQVVGARAWPQRSGSTPTPIAAPASGTVSRAPTEDARRVPAARQRLRLASRAPATATIADSTSEPSDAGEPCKPKPTGRPTDLDGDPVGVDGGLTLEGLSGAALPVPLSSDPGRMERVEASAAPGPASPTTHDGIRLHRKTAKEDAWTIVRS
jgi:hypothetical protein